MLSFCDFFYFPIMLTVFNVHKLKVKLKKKKKSYLTLSELANDTVGYRQPLGPLTFTIYVKYSWFKAQSFKSSS